MSTVVRSLTLSVALLLVAAGPGPAYADIYLPDHPNAPESRCEARFDSASESVACTITSIGRDFVVGADGAGAVRVVLEGPGLLGVTSKTIADCAIATMMSGCVGATSYVSQPYPVGTELTCRAYGVGVANFECSSFDLDS
jgi:hypothetical protein